MTFFRSLMKALAAVGSAIVVMLAEKLLVVLSGPKPSDISAVLWGILGTVGVFIVNYLVGLKKPPVAAEPPPASRQSKSGSF